VPLAISGPIPSSQPSVGSRNPPPLPSPQLRMLFQSTHEERQDADASADPGERTAKSPLQRTLTAQIMGMWAKHNGAVEHIGVKRSVEMLKMQRSVFLHAHLTLILPFSQSFSLPLSPLPPNLTRVQRKKSRCTSTGTLSLFCRTFQRKGY